jgi:hypothetical protein
VTPVTAPLSLRPPFDSISPKEVLYFFDEPMLFTAEDHGGQFLCIRTSEDEPAEYLVVPVDNGNLARLRSGTLSLRSAFLGTLAWHVSVDQHYAVKSAAWLEPGKIPDDFLPEAGVGLNPNHGVIIDEFSHDARDNFLSLSFKGGDLKTGSMSLGTLKQLVDEVYTSLRQIFAPVVMKLFQEPVGEGTISRVLQIPVYQPEFASLNLSFAPPSLDLSGLKKAVNLDYEVWAKDTSRATLNFMTAAEEIHELAGDPSIVDRFTYGAPLALEVLSKISPSATKPFETLEIRGNAGSAEERHIVIDVVRGERIAAAYAMARRDTQSLAGKIVDTNLRSGAIIVQAEGGRETRCDLGKRIMNNEPTEIRNNASVTVFGDLTKRARRDWMLVRKIVLQSGRTYVRPEGEGAFREEK